MILSAQNKQMKKPVLSGISVLGELVTYWAINTIVGLNIFTLLKNNQSTLHILSTDVFVNVYANSGSCAAQNIHSQTNSNGCSFFFFLL